MPIRISVVISTYDNAKALRECLNALEEQSLDKSEYEVLVVNDGKDDVTPHVVLSYQLYNFKYLSLPRRAGVPAAKNYGWRHAEARLVAFTEDYAQPHPDWLKTIVDSYTEDLAIAFSGTIEVPLSDAPAEHERRTAELEDSSFSTVNCACTKTAIEILGGFDERYYSGWRADSDLEFKLIRQGVQVVNLPEAVVVIPPAKKPSWGYAVAEQKKTVFDALLYKKFPRLYRQRIQKTPNWNLYFMIIAVITAAIAFYQGLLILALCSVGIYCLLLTSFIIGRLMFTSRSRGNIIEIMLTSLLIPFVFVFWQIYGSLKYKVFFF